MKKINIIEYKKHIILGITCAALTGMVIVAGNIPAIAENKDEKSASMNLLIPSAGIAKIFDVNDSNSNDKLKEDSTEFVGGIATVLSSYYASNTEESASIKAVDTVLKMLPEKKEEIKAEEIKAEETKAEEKKITSVVDGYTVLGVANVTNYLNVRETPDLDGKILGKLPMNAGCEIIETLEGWYKISSGNVEGYVSAEYLLTGEEANARAKEAIATVAKVNADMLMVREEPNTECTILTRVAEGEELEVVEVQEGWVKVNIDSKTGYVSADYVEVYQSLPKGVTLKELSYSDGVSSTAVDLIEYAKQFLGNPYVYGGTSLTNGTDCSGFTMRIFAQYGYSLSRTSREQANNGTRVSLSEIQPGDLLFYSYGGSIGHVAIYIGNGQIIHASTERTGIIIGNAYYTNPVCATRIIN